MKDPDLTECLNRAKNSMSEIARISDDIFALALKNEEGDHYLDKACKHIWKAWDMLDRYREFIKEDYDEEDLCGTGDADAGCDDSGVLA